MVAWVVAHGLWERPGDGEPRRWARLYNGATALTVTVATLLSGSEYYRNGFAR